jgi:uncharacterized cupredoxin-like copper-binding protein
MFNRAYIKFVALLAFVALAGLLATACASAPSQTAAQVPTTIQATLKEWSIQISSSTVPAGKVTFQVSNQGAIEHEMVILRTDVAPTALAMNSDEPGTALEDSTVVKNVGEVDEVAPGATKSDTFDLTPGKYVLICNEASHYQAGMEIAFVVK